MRSLMIGLLTFLAAGALFGGTILMLSPTGKIIGMPLTILRNSGFNDFLIPGLILFCLLGMFPLFTVWGLLKKPVSMPAEKLNIFPDMHWSWTFAIYTVFVLVTWIQVEMYLLKAVHWLHMIYMILAMAILAISLTEPIRSIYKK